MWNLVRTILIAFALAGFIGQTTAHATPNQVFQNTEAAAGMMDCAETMDMAGEKSGNPGDCCKDMTPDCMAKMGCAAIAAPMPPAPALERPFASRGTRFPVVDVVREGASPLPLKNPPKPLP